MTQKEQIARLERQVAMYEMWIETDRKAITDIDNEIQAMTADNKVSEYHFGKVVDLLLDIQKQLSEIHDRLIDLEAADRCKA